jgi:antitoxin component of MazEF toxin-antitoxin module
MEVEMAKLNKMYYYTKNEKKLNCYYINIPKVLVEKMGLQDKEVEIKQDGNKIVIQKSN